MIKSIKKATILLLTTAMLGVLLSACSSKDENNSQKGSDGEKVEKIVFAMPSFNRIPDNYGAVVDAINDITVEKIGVEVDLQIYGPADYAQKVNLALQSGEKMDIFTTLGQFTSYVSRNQLYPLDELIAEHGKEMMEVIKGDFGADLLDATTMNGHIYGIPVNKGMSVPSSVIYNPELLEAVGYTADDIQSLDSMTEIFAAVKEQNADIVPFGPLNVNPSDTGLMNYLKSMYEVDFLTDTSGVGVVIGDEGKVVNFFETDIFKSGVELMRDWFNKGYLQKDAATTTVLFSEMVGSGRGFAFVGGYSGMEASKSLSAQLGRQVEMKRIAPYYFDTNAVNAVSWMVNSTTDAPEGAVKFLNLLYSNEQLINTILYGIEGVDYEKVDDYHIKFPEGKDANTVSYTAMLSTGLIGSESLQYQLEGVSLSDVELKLKENKDTKRSPYFGFIFDQSDVKAQMSAVTNVVNQYLPGLITGSLDPETMIERFLTALHDAGADKIIASKQEQLDQWLAAQNN